MPVLGRLLDRSIALIGRAGSLSELHRLECDAEAADLVQRVRHYIDESRHSNAFWEWFKKKATGISWPRLDDLLVSHCHLGQIREFFEELDDEAWRWLTASRRNAVGAGGA